MNIVWIGYWSPDGISPAYCQAINKYTPHSAHSIIYEESRGFDTDLVYKRVRWGKDRPDMSENQFVEHALSLLDNADVIIFNVAMCPGIGNSDSRFDDSDTLPFKGLHLDEFSKEKPCVAFLFGATGLRRNYDWYVDMVNAKGWPMLTCQPDVYRNLKLKANNIIYVPILVDLDHPRYSRNFELEGIGENGPIICHSPTDRRIKNTDVFLRVVEDLNKQYKFKVGLIENMGYRESITIKRMSNIGFDQMQVGDYYYCNTSVENSALGLVNIVALDEWAVSLIEQDIGAPLEWENALNEYQLYNILEKYLKDNDLLLKKQQDTYNWFREYWHEKLHIHKITDYLEASI